jgi:hypothetical protein
MNPYAASDTLTVTSHSFGVIDADRWPIATG